ncbi:ABC transporter ATP-binding protein [Eubacterium sp. am_0171]|uniref:energy-coupling factor ABC transporter ATP-binding protein n=1 Tax=unclassified Eubacterium (in: firmicutes) TaxID=2624479 RepID=UPI0010201BA8|nr:MULTISPECIES: ABC transporter ATP-binding protein [unclassified Eubacterium (in: firmicutes)]MSC84123.1 ATP-binding cassette domain-containing protein [Eubacterium sp. BIOML-A1]MSD06209.1 ATP-binding cassette domain-containing protein [Eubacterium sp. BIOML-A2]RYT21452.1 ABC transporter ATP-binding protein [Eubacterium sp. am_0171]
MNTEEQDVIIEARDVHYAYEEGGPHSLNGVSLKIKRGKKVAFMGANGCGKSTFFLCCNGIYKPDKGMVLFEGKPVDYSKKGLLDLRSRVGIVFQDPDNQLFSASVYQEISFGILNMGVAEEKARQEVDQVIGHLEITPFRDRPAHALSGGQKKQVSIADILVMHPEVIILDEPAAALDAKHTKIVNQIVDGLAEEGITILMATHDIDYALSWADEIVLMHEGRVLRHADPVTVCTDQEALAMTNQEEPAVLKLFARLQKKGILGGGLKPPVNIRELEYYIEASSKA